MSCERIHARSAPLLNLFIALIVGGLVAAVFGVIIGVPVLRLKGDIWLSLPWLSARLSAQ